MQSESFDYNIVINVKIGKMRRIGIFVSTLKICTKGVLSEANLLIIRENKLQKGAL